MRKKKCSMEKFSMLLLAFFLGIVKDTDYLEKYFSNQELIKECSGYHIHYFLISSDKYINDKY